MGYVSLREIDTGILEVIPDPERLIGEEKSMYAAIVRLLEDLQSLEEIDDVISWASPVPFFGRIGDSRVATVGINPSSREFTDPDGNSLLAHHFRIETLESLSIPDWTFASGSDIRRVACSFEAYFENNPYRTWFDVLDRLLRLSGVSYYDDPTLQRACHIDLVPFATKTKWGSLAEPLRRLLLSKGRPAMIDLIRDSQLEVLILNGRSVVNEFQRFSGVTLSRTPVESWSLPRRNGEAVPGYLCQGVLTSIDSVYLEREVTVIGYNHNLQSSFGVTSRVMQAIGEYVGDVVTVVIDD